MNIERTPPDQERSSGPEGPPASRGAGREAHGGPHPDGSREHAGKRRERADGRHGDDDRPRPTGRLETLVGRYGPTRGAQRHAGAQDRNLPGILALAFGIAAVAVFLPSFGALFFLSLPLGIAAMVLGVIGKRKVDRRVAARNRRPAKAGLVLGAIGTVLSLLVILLLALGVAGITELIQSSDRSGGGSGGQQETLEQRGDEQRRMLEERAARQRRELEERSARQREELRRRSGESR